MPESLKVLDVKLPHGTVLSMKWRILLLLSVFFALVLAPETALRIRQPDPAGNLAAKAAIHSRGTMGVLHQVLRGQLPREGSHFKSSPAVLLNRKFGMIELDFGSQIPIKALLIQADYDDGYTVETSPDGETWDRMWTISVSKNGKGMRSRHRVFDNPVHTRHLRILPRYPGVSAIGAIRAYSKIPEGWPILGKASVKADQYFFTSTYFRSIFRTKFIIALVAAVLLTVVLALDKLDVTDQKKWVSKCLLILVSIIGALGWWNFYKFNPQVYWGTYKNHWDVYHYYFGGKYSPELKYTNLYECYLTADAEDGFQEFQTTRPNIRDLKTNAMVKTRQVLAHPEKCKACFSKARWADFKKDHAWFRTKLPVSQWMLIPMDHGYNPSPAWAILGRLLSSLGNISDLQFLLLISADTALLLIMFSILWSTFGWCATCAGLAFWGTNFLAGNWFTGAAFLRFDWLFLSVAGLCCLKRGKMAAAGFFFTYATLIRMFPIFFIGGVLFKGLGEMLRRRKVFLSKQHRDFLLGAVVGGIIIVALSLVANGRITVWNEFQQNISKHYATTSSDPQYIGLGGILAYFSQQTSEPPPRTEKAAQNHSKTTPAHKIFTIGAAILFLPLLLAAIIDEEDWVAAILGICWLPFVIGLANYYYAVLIVFALLMVRKRVIGFAFAAMTVICSGLALVPEVTKMESEFSVWSSFIVIAFFLWVTIIFAFPWFTHKKGEIALSA